MAGSGSRFLWVAVGYVVHDCIGSVFLDRTYATAEAQATGPSSGSSGATGSGGSGDTAGSSAAAAAAALLFVDKASLRFFKFSRGELILMK